MDTAKLLCEVKMLLDCFWLYKTDMPKDVAGMKMFGGAHFLWIAVIIAALIICCIVYRKSGERARRRALVIMSAAMLTLKAMQLAILAYQEHLEMQYIPLHLCGMALFVCFLYALGHSDFFGQVLYSLCMPGAWLALIFPEWLAYPAFCYENIYSFFVHGMLVIFPAMLIAGGTVTPSIKKIWMPIVFLLVVIPPVYAVNKAFGTNFFFISWPSPGSPLILLEKWLGDPGYLFGYAGLILAMIVVMYAAAELLRCLKREMKREKA